MTLAKALQYVSKTFHGLCKSPLALLLPPLFQILCDICLKYFMIPAKALRYMSKKFHDSCKSLLALLLPSSIPSPTKAVQYMSKIFHDPCKNPPLLLHPVQQKPSDICL